jgi:ABC-type multidrug transport system fused ATPase/permease subunit
MDSFVLISGALNIVGTLLLAYLAIGSYREGRKLRRLQLEVAELMSEVHGLQSEMRADQRSAQSELLETKETVQRVARATQRRRLPRLRFDFGGAVD